MTALIFFLQPKQLIVAMDTLSAGLQDGKLRNYFFTSKMYPVPHLSGLICGTGYGNFVAEWLLRSKDFLVEDIVHLGQFTQRELQKLWTTYSEGGGTSTIYHFGWDRKESRYRGFAFRSTSDFAIEELGYGSGTKPGIPNVNLTTFPDSIIETMQEQRANEERRPLEDRTFIGGEIQAAYMEGGNGISLSTVHRFPDYEATYMDMCKHLT